MDSAEVFRWVIVIELAPVALYHLIALVRG
jgi:hypothetical protein